MRFIASLLAVCLSLATPLPTQAKPFRTPIRACGENLGLIHDNEVDKDLHWEKKDFPLTLVIHPNVVPSWGWAIEKSVDIWNRRVGFEMFRLFYLDVPDATFEELLEVSPDGFIPVMGMDDAELSDLLHRRVLGVTFIDSDEEGVIHNAPVLLPLNTRAHWPPKGIFTVVHEFGHVLGLAHDPCKESVMYFSDYPGAEEVLRIIQEDVTLLRELYAPEHAKDPDFELKIPRFIHWGLLD